jgi:hypothetical protein
MKRCPRCLRAYHGNVCARCAGKGVYAARLRNSHQWKQTSIRIRIERPACEDEDCGGMSRECHHIIHAEDRPELFFDEGNIEALCIECHKRRHGK